MIVPRCYKYLDKPKPPHDQYKWLIHVHVCAGDGPFLNDDDGNLKNGSIVIGEKKDPKTLELYDSDSQDGCIIFYPEYKPLWESIKKYNSFKWKK